jgi:hypothetical protein
MASWIYLSHGDVSGGVGWCPTSLCSASIVHGNIMISARINVMVWW